MSERKIASVAGGAGTVKSRQSVQSFQPIWMAHWMQPGSRHGHGEEEFDCVSRGHNMKNGSKSFRPVNESGVTDTTNFEIASSKGDENKTACWSRMKHRQITDDKYSLQGAFGHNIKRDKAIDGKGGTFSFAIPAMNEASFGRWNSAGEGTSKGLPEWMETHSSAIDTLKPSHGPMTESSKQIVPYDDLSKCEFDKGKAPLIMKSPIVSRDQFTSSTMRMLEQEHCYKDGQQADLFSERQIESHLDTGMGVRLKDLNATLSLDTPSTSHHHLPTLGQAWLQKMQNHSSCGTFPSQGVISDKRECNKPYCDRYPLQKLPCGVHDMQTTRICATMNSIEETPEGFHTSRNIHSISPFSGQVKRGVELHSLNSSYNSEGKRDIEDVTISKVGNRNESSTETDTLDVDLLKEENSNSGGANHNNSVKSINIGSTLSPRINATSCGNIRQLWKKAIPPDSSNQQLPSSSAAASSSENVRPTSSRTQTLDMDVDKLPAHSNHPTMKSDISGGGPFEADPTMRWVKRLKLKSPNCSSQGTKSSKLGENSSPDEMRKIFKKIIESDIADSKPPSRSHHAEETIMSGKSQGLSKMNEDFMEESTRKGKESLLSQAWIKRWLRRGSKVTKKKPLMVVCEPQNFKLTLDDFQTKPFPSIAAMALMGKFVNGLHSCELQKQDTFTIWNTKAF